MMVEITSAKQDTLDKLQIYNPSSFCAKTKLVPKYLLFAFIFSFLLNVLQPMRLEDFLGVRTSNQLNISSPLRLNTKSILVVTPYSYEAENQHRNMVAVIGCILKLSLNHRRAFFHVITNPHRLKNCSSLLRPKNFVIILVNVFR